MKSFVREHWFKIGILLLLCIALGACGYYFFYFLPSEEIFLLAVNNQPTANPIVTTSPSTIPNAPPIEKLEPETVTNNVPIPSVPKVSNRPKTVSSDTMSQSLLRTVMAHIVYVKCYGSGKNVQGSGTAGLLKASDPTVVTNFHVVGAAGGINATCTINLPTAPDYSLGTFYVAQVGLFDSHYPDVDAAILHVQNVSATDSGLFQTFPLSFCDEGKVQIGDKVTLLGYPAIGQATITVTDGIISGFVRNQYGVVYKTSALLDHGISGGLAVLNNASCVLGIPTWEVSDTQSGANLGYVQSWDSIRNSGDIF